LNFSSNVSAKVITLKINTVVGKSFTSGDKNVTLLVRNISTKPAKVTINGENVDFKTNENTLEIPVVLKKGLDNEIKIQL
jgi:oligosaccharide 4-alpha-D-glucosyltransferase